MSNYLVDRNDKLRFLHTSQMLDSTRDTDGDVELRSDNLTKTGR